MKLWVWSPNLSVPKTCASLWDSGEGDVAEQFARSCNMGEGDAVVFMQQDGIADAPVLSVRVVGHVVYSRAVS